MFSSAFGGGAAAVPAVEPQVSSTTSAAKDNNISNKDSRDSLYTFDEAKLESLRKTKPWMQE